MEAIIITLIICTTIVILAIVGKNDVKKTYDANVNGYLLTKSDRINGRIEKFKATVKTQNSTIAVSDFLKFVKAIQIMIAQELTYEGIKKS